MSSAKRLRSEVDEVDTPSYCTDRAVCDPCRVKKIRCGRERPNCNNCTRLAQDCSWSGQGKKPNQAVALHHAVDHLASRMTNLETGIDQIHQLLQRFSPSPGSASNSSSRLWCATDSDSTAPSEQPQKLWNPRRRPGSRQVLLRNAGWEEYIGPLSLDALILDVKEFALDPLLSGEDGSPPTSRAATSASDKLSELLTKAGQVSPQGSNRETSSVDQPLPAMPPINIVEMIMETYFTSINPRLPIWSRSRFHRLIQTCRDPSAQDGQENRAVALAVCCNNMVVLTLSAQSLAAKCPANKSTQSRTLQDTNNTTQRPSMMELDLIQTFVANAKRALACLHKLLEPNLLNLQALLSLYLVCRQYFPEHAARLVFHHATFVSEAIGLGRYTIGLDRWGPEDLEERRHVAYCICVLGSSPDCTSLLPWGLASKNARSRTSGWAQPSPPGDSEPHADVYSTSLDLARIEHRLFSIVPLDLPPDGGRDPEIHSVISALHQDLLNWYEQHGERYRHNDIIAGLADSGASQPGKLEAPTALSSNTECIIRYYTTKILLSWIMPDGPDDALEYSRKCLRIWADAEGINVGDPGHFATLGRLLACQPPIALIQVFIHLTGNTVATSSSTNDDLQLVKSFAAMARLVADSSEPKSHAKRLASFATILADFAVTYRTTRVPEAPVSPQRPSPNVSELDSWLNNVATQDSQDSSECWNLGEVRELNMTCDSSSLTSTSFNPHFDLVEMNSDLFMGYPGVN